MSKKHPHQPNPGIPIEFTPVGQFHPQLQKLGLDCGPAAATNIVELIVEGIGKALPTFDDNLVIYVDTHTNHVDWHETNLMRSTAAYLN